ncbi:MAG: acyltransferase [Acidaminococcaceae bacterium]|nr:acyltransferase [Acidaminococcaceae bacterium]
MSRENQRLFSLELVRAFSTALILVYHFNIQLGFHGIGGGPVFIQRLGYENAGSLGITLFIILSGAGLMYSCYDGISLATFYQKRIKSIFPIYYLCYFFTFLTLFYAYGVLPVNHSPLTFPLTLLGLDGFLYELLPNLYLCGEWFVGFILIFYLVFPLLRKFVLAANGLTKVCFYLTYAGFYIALTQTNLIQELIPLDATRNPVLRLPEFLFGMEWAKRERESKGVKGKRLALAAGCLFLFLFVTFVPLPTGHLPVALICGITSFLMLDAIAGMAEKFSAKKSMRLCVSVIGVISKYSFAVILTHHNLIALLIWKFDLRSDLGSAGLYSLFFCCVVVIAVASYLLYKLNNKLLSGGR